MKQSRFFTRHPHAKYLALPLIYLAVYSFAERLVTSHYWVSYLPLDDWIPFIPSLIVPYSLWYPAMFVIGIYLLRTDSENFKRYMRFLFLDFYLCEWIWLLFPNGQNLRVAITGQESVFTWVLSMVYAADTNTNVLPSAHVVGSIAVAAATWHCPALQKQRWLRTGAVLLCCLIAISTVFVKQHSILDVLAALVLCTPLYLTIYSPKAPFRLPAPAYI